MSTTKCQLDTLYMSSTCDIQHCADCGLIHLTMGPLTLRLSEQHYKELSQDINKGLIQMQSQQISEDTGKKNNVRTLHS